MKGSGKNSGKLLPVYPDLMVLEPGGPGADGMMIEKAPSWICAWVGKTSGEVEGKTVGEVFDPITKSFSAISRDVLKDGIPVKDYHVEFKDIDGKERVISIDAQRALDYTNVSRENKDERLNEIWGYRVQIRVRDITSLVSRVRTMEEPVSFHGIIGRSGSIHKVFHKIEVYGPADSPVVITGETGTGKELVARALHEHSPRRNRSFVAVNCSALNDDLFESELFGHERGSFTGALKSHKGRFERAHQGTLFLDEIGDMPWRIQVKLLRVLETGTIERVGGERELPVDIRLIAATNIPLEKSVANGRFRPDLYHRISVFRIHVPALRERKDDIILLVNYFLKILNMRYKKNIIRMTPEALRLLENYYWPGNVRELRNVLERVYVESAGPVIGRNAFNEWVRERDYLSAGDWNLERLEKERTLTSIVVPAGESTMYPMLPGHKEQGKIIDAQTGSRQEVTRSSEKYGKLTPGKEPWFAENQALDAEYRIFKPMARKHRKLTPLLLQRAYQDSGGNITRASAILGIHKATFYRHMKLFGLTREMLASPRELRNGVDEG